jgi:hypothetical protein
MSRYAFGLAVLAMLAAGGCDDQSVPPSSGGSAPAPTQPTLRKITPADLRVDATTSTAVISSAQKFILPIPALAGGGEPLRYPAGHAKAGAAILDFQGKPIGERGLVFFNDKDQTVQAVGGDGEGVIIINEVTEEQADRLTRKIVEFSEDPNRLALRQLKLILEFARADLKLGDMYNSNRAFVRSRMTPVVAGAPATTQGAANAEFGLKKRDDRDICYAVYVPGGFVFEGPAATPQVFENGGVIVAQGGELRGVQSDVFVRTYRLADGRRIESPTADLKVWGKS